jgi:hypothetical protein
MSLELYIVLINGNFQEKKRYITDLNPADFEKLLEVKEQ